MPGIPAPKFVYRRRKFQKNSVTVISAQASGSIKSSEHCVSAVSSDVSPIAVRSRQSSQFGPNIEANRTLIMPTVICNIDPLISKSDSIDGCSLGELHESYQAPKNNVCKNIGFHCVNDSCSSSKSNTEHDSACMKAEVDDTTDCSSSGVSAIEGPKEDLSEKDFCICILKNVGLLERSWPISAHVSSEDFVISGNGKCSLSCKVCGHPELTCNMLICDHCEEAYHVSCCTPRIKKIPGDEWLCPSCLKKKHIILRENTMRKSLNSSSDLKRCKIATCKGESNPIAFMLKDVEPYSTGVRIGKAFQADVPDSSDPIKSEDADCIGEEFEMGPSECVRLNNSNKPSRLSSIGNWLQCQEVIEGIGDCVDGTICGKWRRAPLFEVQTNDWECFRSVLWDPAHADCAVPQELDTDQVLKQLKCIEMLRPRLAAKR